MLWDFGEKTVENLFSFMYNTVNLGIIPRHFIPQYPTLQENVFLDRFEFQEYVRKEWYPL